MSLNIFQLLFISSASASASALTSFSSKISWAFFLFLLDLQLIFCQAHLKEPDMTLGILCLDHLDR
jgi:hypothetical protein